MSDSNEIDVYKCWEVFEDHKTRSNALKSADDETIVWVLEEIIGECSGNADIYRGYSGRNMYGKKCYGISCANPMEVIEYASVMGFSGAHMDSFGLGSIVYWPSFIVKD